MISMNKKGVDKGTNQFIEQMGFVAECLLHDLIERKPVESEIKKVET